MRRGITIAEPEILNEIRERATWPVRKKMHSNDFDVKTGVTAHAFAPPAFSSRLTLPGVELILTDQTGFAFRRTHDPALPKSAEVSLVDTIAGEFSFYFRMITYQGRHRVRHAAS